jgi:DNA-binding beta-propeller fold protein YncE
MRHLSFALLLLLTACGRSDAPPTTEPAPVPEPMRIVAGSGTEGFQDGIGSEARFRKPIRLAPLTDDSIAVADIFNHAIREVGLDGRVRTIVGGPERKGFRDGPAEDAQLTSPHGVAVSREGLIAVAEASNHTIRLLTPTTSPDGEATYEVSTLAGAAAEEGLVDGPAHEASFRSPHAALWAPDGALIVPDIGNARIRRIHEGSVETLVGAEEGTFKYPMDIAWAPDGTLLIADAGTNEIRTWSPTSGLGTLTTRSELHTPHGVAAGPDGTVYVADMDAHQVVAIDAEGEVTRVAGTGEQGGGPLQLSRPAAVLVHAGHLWIADLDNHRIVVVALR